LILPLLLLLPLLHLLLLLLLLLHLLWLLPLPLLPLLLLLLAGLGEYKGMFAKPETAVVMKHVVGKMKDHFGRESCCCVPTARTRR
jgi:hypothetical protein